MNDHPVLLRIDEELRRRGVSAEDIEFIHSLVLLHRQDEDCLVLENDFDRRLKERGLMDIFHEASRDTGVNWHHSICPPY